MSRLGRSRSSRYVRESSAKRRRLRSPRSKRLQHPQASEVLLQGGVDRRRWRRAARRRPARPSAGTARWPPTSNGSRASSTRASVDVEQQQRHDHADDGQGADEQAGEAGLQEVRQRVDVRRHPGHDPAGRLALVVVEPEPLQVGEGLHPQQVEQALAGAAGDQQVAPADRPRAEHDQRAPARAEARAAWSPSRCARRGRCRCGRAAGNTSRGPGLSATRARPSSSQRRTGRTSCRRPNAGSADRASSSGMSGSPAAGGSAATCASSSADPAAAPAMPPSRAQVCAAATAGRW